MARIQCADLEVVWDVAGPDDAPPVLMINGLGATHAGWSLQVAALSERFRVYSYDNRDVGETGEGREAHPYQIERFARDAATLIEILEIGPAHIIGASMGGAIALELALHRPDLVRTAQIVCSWARTDRWLAELLGQWKVVFRELGPLAWSRDSWLWVFTHRWYTNPERLESLVRDAAAYPFPQTAAMFERQTDAAIGFDAIDRIRSISIPVHVIAGEEDIFTPLRYSEEIVAAVPGAQLTVLPKVGHGMFWETPEAFNAALLRYLARFGASGTD